MQINFSDPLSGLASCEAHKRGKLFDTCVSRLGTTGAIHSYIEYDQHIAPQGGFKKIKDMAADFRGLISYEAFVRTIRLNYPIIYEQIKEAGGHRRE